MPRHKKKKSKAIKKSLPPPVKCDKEKCEQLCQAMTQYGTQCSRKARINLDLRKGKKILGYQVIPKINCCFFCLQHAAMFTGYAVHEIGMLLATKDMSWDEYLTINPDYLYKKMGY